MEKTITPTDILPPGISDMGLLCPELLRIYEALRKDFRIWEIYVNEWAGKRANNWCGYRTQECGVGAANSAHKRGLALDLHAGTPFAGIEIRKSRNSELWRYLKIHGHEYGIKRLEDIDSTPTWCHIDLVAKEKWNHQEGVYVFKP